MPWNIEESGVKSFRVTGKDMFGNTFYRGIYLGGAATFPLYYQYTINANRRGADYSISRLWWQESWLTEVW
jgi:hypothetical protein